MHGNGGGGSSSHNNNNKYSKYQNGGVKSIEEQMSEMYEHMYGIPMDDDDMEMDMEPMNEEEFRATMNGHNGSNLDIIHEKPDDEVDASGSRGEASKSGSGKHESPQDAQKGNKAEGKDGNVAKKPPKKPNGAANGSEPAPEVSKKSSDRKKKEQV